MRSSTQATQSYSNINRGKKSHTEQMYACIPTKTTQRNNRI
jgi:hypothetical protein